MKDVMIDLETLGISQNAVIVQMAGVYFDRFTGVTFREICINVSVQDSVNQGFEMNPNTVLWWLKQSKEAQKSVFETDVNDIESAYTAMRTFNDFLQNAYCIWSHNSFDFPLVQNHLKKLNITPKFSYRAGKDIRTLTDLAWIDPKDYDCVGVAHNALDDCKFQIKYCVDAFNKLRKS